MSIQVALDELAAAMREFAHAYLLTLGTAPRPHVVAVRPTVAGDLLRVPDLGRTSRRNIEGNDAVTLLWPPRDPGGYTLIVDGRADVHGEEAAVTPERAVLHRPAPAAAGPADGACASDCVELPVPGPTRR